jgi:hypothetical protein
MTIFEAHRLIPWEEGTLRLSSLTEENGSLIASGERFRLCLPLDMKDKLAKCVGKKISILRTDEGYCTRVLDRGDAVD